MDTAEYRVDRTGWPLGPWDIEGDREQWTTAAGLPGLIARNRLGAWCGYAAVTPDHPYHGYSYEDIDEGIHAHGGLTYASRCFKHICHTPQPGQADTVWWFGFDCAHASDLAPGLLALESLNTDQSRHAPRLGAYRTAAYARAEVENLAAQLAGHAH